MNCQTCATCQMRTRFNLVYQKYLKDNGDKADVEFIARMIKMDKEILVCQRLLVEHDPNKCPKPRCATCKKLWADFEAEGRSVCYEEQI